MFDGESIEYTSDHTHDAFGSPMKRVTFCKAIYTVVWKFF